ncbi:hypothetical protein [Caminibacter pacificus]|uniref:Uncharacterized protein n=1 Tax=Caminibacter pacificus TaxID=1424653 RepID=A0AAJ4RB40_9BACT|nr:hypothetical protein [Caminibacter pacificus]QDD68158.1 hypothetical protein C6V80_09905 [Caminibacter pacificus]ROR38776.1 hypothetical protein EDC58_1991 [Caminibacter pacificus]
MKLRKILIFLLIISIANAGMSLSFGSIRDQVKEQISKQINKNATSKLADLIGVKKDIISNIINGTKLGNLPGLTGLDSFINSITMGYVNFKCVKPTFKKPKFNLCDMDFDKFKIKLGPCEAKATNPLKDLYDKMCNKKKKKKATSSTISFLDSMNAKISDVNLSNIITPSGISLAKIYGDDKNPSFYAVLAKKNPSNPAVSSWLNNDRKTLILQDKTVKFTGTTDISRIELPKNRGLWLKSVYDSAKKFSEIVPDYLGIYEEVTSQLTEKFVNISGNTLSEIRAIESKEWQNVVNSPEIKNIFNVVNQAYDMYYANKLLILNAKSKFYQYAPTQDRLNLLPVSKRTDVKYKSIVYSAQVTDLMAKKEIEKKKTNQNISLVLKAAYISSLDFRDDIAQKEIDTLINSVQ